MQWLQNFFSSATTQEQDPEYSQAIQRAETALSGLTESEARFIACVAFLMARVGHVDSQLSEAEKETIQEVLKTQMKLSPPLAEAALAIVVESTLSRSIENHLVIRRLNEIASLDQKFDVIRALFRVASDNDISERESDEVGLIAAGLLLSRSDFISLRSEFRNQLSILKHGI